MTDLSALSGNTFREISQHEDVAGRLKCPQVDLAMLATFGRSFAARLLGGGFALSDRYQPACNDISVRRPKADGKLSRSCFLKRFERSRDIERFALGIFERNVVPRNSDQEVRPTLDHVIQSSTVSIPTVGNDQFTRSKVEPFERFASRCIR
jgi:hypothetical protein